MNNRTKIICTIGPSVNTLDKLIELIKAGMNVARLNFSHGTHQEHLASINRLKQARSQLKVPLAIMLDTKGPEIRIGKIKNNEAFLNHGQRLLLVRDPIEGDAERISVTPGYILELVPPGTTILFDNGYITSRAIEVTPEGLVIQIDHGGKISSNKGVNIPNTSLDLPAFTDKDVEDIKFGCDNNIDIIAASFVRSAEHVLAIKRLLDKQGRPDILVLAKIENNEGVENFDSIIQVADGVMVARGDLGVEVPLSQVPRLQKMMIRKSYLAGKPSVTATQMLESMINSPRPTRAETSDVANAIYDSTSAVMLSGETAVGKYPIEVVEMMRTIITEAESDFHYRSFFEHHTDLIFHDVPSSITLAAVKTAYSSNATAIFAFTRSGSTARLLSRLRPEMPVIAMTSSEESYHQLSINWGVIPFLSQEHSSITEAFKHISDFALKNGYVSHGDLVVVTAGSPFGVAGTTNMMLVENIGDVPVRGHSGIGEAVYGNVTMLMSLEERQPYSVRGNIIVIGKCDESYLPYIKESIGVLLQNQIDDVESEKTAIQIAETLGKPILIRADGASRNLKEGQLVTLNPEKALVYKGVIL
jgi:pyruvate kinase